MNTTVDPRASEIARYVEEVGQHLAASPSLPRAEREELLDDLTQHLAEVAAEHDGALVDRLGSPEAYADELLAASGFGSVAPGHRQRRWRTRVERVVSSPRMQRAAAFARELDPAWWVVRGYLAASLLGALTSGRGGGLDYPGFPVPAVADSRLAGALVVIGAVSLSVRWGRAAGSRWRWAQRAAGVVLAVYGLALLGEVGEDRVHVEWASPPDPIAADGCLRNGEGQVIENLFPYDADGRLLDRVLLYDQTGRPVDNLCPSEFDQLGRRVVTEYGRDENGAPVINVFPRRQTAGPPRDMSSLGGPVTPPTVAVPPPAVVVPRLATPSTTTPTTTTPTTAPDAPS